MSNKNFFAAHWFKTFPDSSVESKENAIRIDQEQSSQKSQHSRFPQFTKAPKRLPSPPLAADKFYPFHCFIPGWRGESLLSKNTRSLENILHQLEEDILGELFKASYFPRSIKQGIYGEFLSYANSLHLNFETFSDLKSFWSCIYKLKESNHDDSHEMISLKSFLKIYSNRVATIILLKLKFISHLIESCGFEINEKAILYPSAYLSQIFKSGSQTELKCSALESNIYSWYRPHGGMKKNMKDLFHLTKELSITEMTKYLSQKTQTHQSLLYSHALSHLSTGLFLNSLQINFPLWIEALESQKIPQGYPDEEKIISTKYTGDFLESLSLSHWLAQENNMNFKWDELLCPDFKGSEFQSGNFFKICNELHFLTFLTKKSSLQKGTKTIEYLCRVMGKNFKNRKNYQFEQGILFDENPFLNSHYDRVILNLCQFPKNNPQHYLISQIMDQIQDLKPNGYLFVLSSKKLFVPSLRERLTPLLKELKVEAVLDFESLKGKGELGPYIFIFRKISSPAEQKQLCSYFRFSGELNNFNEFIHTPENLRSFYLTHLQDVPALSQQEFDHGNIKLDFYQEAIINGMMIHSATEDSSRITHPSYFKSLLSNCVTLDTLYEVKNLSHKKSFHHSFNLGLNKDYGYFLVVDFREQDVSLEIFPMEAFESVYSEYGATLCSYFHISPKIFGLNPNLLRNYFITPVGKQLINLTFNSGPNFVKSSLTKFLVPKFLSSSEALPPHIQTAIQLLDLSEGDLLKTSASDLLETFKHINQLLLNISTKYLNEVLSRLSNFERSIQSIVWKLNDVHFGQKISFLNPIIQEKLVHQKTTPLYPGHEDVYIEFVHGTTPADIHLYLTSCEMVVSSDKGLKFFYLVLKNNDQDILKLHADETMILFLQFLLEQAKGLPFSKILKAIYIPRSHDLKNVINTTAELKKVYEEILQEVQQTLMNSFRKQVLAGEQK